MRCEKVLVVSCFSMETGFCVVDICAFFGFRPVKALVVLTGVRLRNQRFRTYRLFSPCVFPTSRLYQSPRLLQCPLYLKKGFECVLKASSFIRFLDVRFSKRYFLKIELIQDIEIAHRQFRLVTRS